MRFYKIKTEKYLDLANSYLEKAKKYNKHNQDIIEDVFPSEVIDNVMGSRNQGIFTGQCFSHDNKTDKFDGFIVKKDGKYYPNKRTKKGKELHEKLTHQKQLMFFHMSDHFGIKLYFNGKFIAPYLYVLNNNEIVLKCDASIKLNRNDFEEVTLTYVEDNYN